MNKHPLLALILVFVTTHAFPQRNPFEVTTPHKTLFVTLHSLIIPIHYAKAPELLSFIKKMGHHSLSVKGDIQADIRTNQLWLRDDSAHIKVIKHLIHQLDIPVSQVLIKARIVTVEDNFVHSLGLIFGTEQQKNSQQTLSMDLPRSSTSAGIATIPIANLGNGHLLDLELTALEQQGHAQVISSPELMTSNRQTALIESGEEVPYQEKTGQGNTSVAFKKATLRLKVTPVIMPGQRILLHLTVNQDKISSLLINGVPAIRTEQLSTQVRLKDMETVVLGGIVEHTLSHQEEGVPLLRKIPIIGALFRTRRQVNEHRQLFIFVTPQIIHG